MPKQTYKKYKIFMKRNAEGIAVFEGGTTIKVDPKRSILSYANPHCNFFDGGVYKEDGYIYDTNGNHLIFGKHTKRKHMLKSYVEQENDGPLIWEPIKNDIKKLEQRRWRIFLEFQKKGKEHYQAYQDVINAGGAHVQISHKYHGDKDPWWFYKVVDNGERYGNGISFDWVKEPETPINLDIGNHYYNISRITINFGGRHHKFLLALQWAIYQYLQNKEPPKSPGAILKLIINGRMYLYAGVYLKFGNGLECEWKKQLYPEAEMTEIEI